jgi:gamma-glutamyltranspeptidase / glutathione hydrolase
MPVNSLLHYPYSSGRRVVMGRRHAAATSQPLATLAGMEMFWAGGNAVDAAIAMAIALTVVEPTSNGIGSDAFALVWDGQLHGLNASGRSPALLTREQVGNQAAIPPLGWLPVTVPGAVSAWRSLWERWGKLPFEQLFEPAIRYAEQGFPVSPETARSWQAVESLFVPLAAPEFQPFKQVFFPHDRAPVAGEIWGSRFHAQTLRELAKTGGESFYRGSLAVKISAFASDTGGLLQAEDLANHRADWVDPISTTYRDCTVWEIPPNGQGIAALMALNILEGLPLSQVPRESVDGFHWQIEAMKLAFEAVYNHVADADWMQVTIAELLQKDYAAQQRQRIGDQAITIHTEAPTANTVYLATADQDLMVSFIQSNYAGFGSGILIPETGIALQNRGTAFSLNPQHPNGIAPNKRPFHTIIPGFLTQNGQPLGPFGVMGGHMQPQGHVQVVTNLVDYGLNPQAALDAPRWQVLLTTTGCRILLEQAVPQSVILRLAERGHQVQVAAEGRWFGKGQIIVKQGDALVAASEPRADGLALAG